MQSAKVIPKKRNRLLSVVVSQSELHINIQVTFICVPIECNLAMKMVARGLDVDAKLVDLCVILPEYRFKLLSIFELLSMFSIILPYIEHNKLSIGFKNFLMDMSKPAIGFQL